MTSLLTLSVDRRAFDLTGRSPEGAGAAGDGDVIGAAVGLVGRQQRGAGDRAAQQLEGALALQLAVQHQRAHRVQRAHLVAVAWRRFALNMNSSPGAPFCVWLMLDELAAGVDLGQADRATLVGAAGTCQRDAADRRSDQAGHARGQHKAADRGVELPHGALPSDTCETRRAGSLPRSADLSRGVRAHAGQAGDTLRRPPALMRSSSASPCASIRSSTMAQMASGESVPAALGSSSAA